MTVHTTRTLLALVLAAGLLARRPRLLTSSAVGRGAQGGARRSSVLHAYELAAPAGGRGLPRGPAPALAQGTVELRAKDNTLVIRDTPRRARPRSCRRSRPSTIRLAGLEIEVTSCRPTRRARSRRCSPTQALSPELTARLKQMLPYYNYQVQASSQLRTREGEEVTYQVWARASASASASELVRPMAAGVAAPAAATAASRCGSPGSASRRSRPGFRSRCCRPP